MKREFRVWASALAIAFSLGVASSPARAEPSAKEVLSLIDKGDQVALLILDAYSNGMDWANSELQSRNTPRLYCAPRNLAITANQTADILRQYLKSPDGSVTSHLPAGLILLRALQATFPCE